jgi:excisionase family DNA binding protein
VKQTKPRPTPAPITAETSPGHPETDQTAERLAYSIREASRLTGLSRDLLYDEMRRGNLSYIKVGRRRLITRQHLQQFLGIAS